jgi:predicted DsbA family dithiol-disulfide isomerase
MEPVKIVHFSDVLCVWAYVGQANLFRLVHEFGDDVQIEVHFCSVFPDAQTKIKTQWLKRGGFDGYGDHVKSIAAGFENIGVHDDVWCKVQPRSSASPHLFIKAIELLDQNPDPKSGNGTSTDRLSIKAGRELRAAFFADAQDISNWSSQRKIAEKIGIDFEAVLQKIETGEAIAKLAADYELAQSLGVQGSPTYILNEGRQKLFGNIGYGILAANIKELLVSERDESASLCS